MSGVISTEMGPSSRGQSLCAHSLPKRIQSHVENIPVAKQSIRSGDRRESAWRSVEPFAVRGKLALGGSAVALESAGEPVTQ